MKNLTLTLSIEEINLVLDALGQQPFNKVFQLIGKIQQQASGQLQGGELQNPEAVVDNPPKQ
ncbi:MAG: hypothetical protein D6730_21250 [Bacteroidetes bacterium]|nr:MAG: hypothetical protein D6730_21250 [Bacteroidota bacterium]